MRVACAQYAVREGDPEHNRWRSLDFVRRAVAAGADLVVLPELATSGCAFASRRDALAEEYPAGAPSAPGGKRRRDPASSSPAGCWRGRGRFFSTPPVLVGPDLLGRYRKTHLWDGEKRLYEPGRELPVFKPLGNIGFLICYDAWFPEAARAFAMKGAQVLCVPSTANAVFS